MSDDQTPRPAAGDPTPGPDAADALKPVPDADDVAFARLRAADPAAGVTPDVDRVRAAVAAQVAAEAGTTATTVAGAVPTVPDELAAARSRRAGRLRWLPVAAAVAGFAEVGGGGYAVGAARDGGAAGTSADLAAPAMTLEQPAVGGADASAPEAARGAASMAGDVASSKLAWYGGRVVFTAGSGLSGEGGSATAWALDAASVFSAETVARVAAALGVAGEPRQEYGSWTVGPTDGSGATVSLSPDGSASVSYYDPARDPWSCVRSAPETLDSSGAGTDGATGAAEPAIVDPGAGCEQPNQPAAPTGDAAEAKAREVLASLGVDADGFEYEVMSDTGIAQLVQVTAYQVVDDQRTGLAWNVSLVGDGVQSLWGSLAPLVDLGAYDVVSPRAAVERLTDPRFGSTGGGMMPFAAADMARSAESGIAVDPAAEPTVPPTATAGPIAWPVEDVTITSARLGLAFTSLPDGAAVLLPTYELSSDDGRTWTVVAVADDELDFSVPR
ncbi:hypothetical protein [Cellulomonas biazotea]|uniref:hypothetical protein n=1 Tax=Cellulomonas biazotea TaxID=1709 RepID=UPI0035EDEA63